MNKKTFSYVFATQDFSFLCYENIFSDQMEHSQLPIFFVFSYQIVTECSRNSGVLGGASRSSPPGEFQNSRRQ